MFLHSVSSVFLSLSLFGSPGNVFSHKLQLQNSPEPSTTVNYMASYLDTADPALTENSPAFDQLLHSFNTVQTRTKITF